MVPRVNLIFCHGDPTLPNFPQRAHYQSCTLPWQLPFLTELYRDRDSGMENRLKLSKVGSQLTKIGHVRFQTRSWSRYVTVLSRRRVKSERNTDKFKNLSQITPNFHVPLIFVILWVELCYMQLFIWKIVKSTIVNRKEICLK